MAAYHRAIALDANNVGALTGLASALEKESMVDEAIAVLRSTLEVTPANADLHVRIGKPAGWTRQLGRSERRVSEWLGRRP